MSKVLNQTGKQIYAADVRSPYDSEAINILKDKQYLARILKECVAEFENMSVDEIIPCINTAHVGTIPVEPGLSDMRIAGDATDSKVINEGVVTYDIRFMAVIPKKGKVGIRLRFDVELQQKETPGYDIVSRGVLYGGRMLSEQMGNTVFGKNYDDLQKVYSIWICMNTPLSRANTISRYSIKHDPVYGMFKEKGRSDLLQVILIRLPKEGCKNEPVNKPTKLMELLSATFSKSLSPKEKLQKIDALGVKVADETKGRINTMCNLSQGIFEDGMKKGLRKGREKERLSQIKKMLEKGKSPQEISDFCDYSMDEIMRARDLLSENL